MDPQNRSYKTGKFASDSTGKVNSKRVEQRLSEAIKVETEESVLNDKEPEVAVGFRAKFKTNHSFVNQNKTYAHKGHEPINHRRD